jgi:hypothetical protein
MSEAFIMKPGVDYEVIEPDHGRPLGYFRDNRYFEGNFITPVGALKGNQFVLGGRVLGKLVGNKIELGGKFSCRLEVRLAA